MMACNPRRQLLLGRDMACVDNFPGSTTTVLLFQSFWANLAGQYFYSGVFLLPLHPPGYVHLVEFPFVYWIR
jgi:hypothetical protein